jgi:hypothetical protein
MATIRRHPVPSDSYQPDRPLNDLVRSQFEHFREVAGKHPEVLKMNLQVPSHDDVAGVSQFMAAVTGQLMSLKTQPLKLVSKRRNKPQATAPTVGLAAVTEPPTASKVRSKPKKTTTPSKSNIPYKGGRANENA